jgi:hypothetical protein
MPMASFLVETSIFPILSIFGLVDNVAWSQVPRFKQNFYIKDLQLKYKFRE